MNIKQARFAHLSVGLVISLHDFIDADVSSVPDSHKTHILINPFAMFTNVLLLCIYCFSAGTDPLKDFRVKGWGVMESVHACTDLVGKGQDVRLHIQYRVLEHWKPSMST